MPLILAIAAVVLLFSIRGCWIVWQAGRYGYLASYYCLRTRQSAEIAADMSLVWPTDRILWHLWCWDWRHYVVDHDSFDAMCEWIHRELQRQDLDQATYDREVLAARAALDAEQRAAAEKVAEPTVTTSPTSTSTLPPASP